DAVLEPGAPFILAALGFDARMRAARALVVGEGRLDRTTLEGKAAGEAATRARQAGVPCHAIAGSSTLDAFDARILDLQGIVAASSLAGLEAAGAVLGRQLTAESRPAG
ncbi:MAG: glycerate kinase, partial [Solirubrobacteraceae bacterium]